MTRGTKGYPVQIPILRPLSSIELKSERLRDAWRNWEATANYAKENNQRYENLSALGKKIASIFGRPKAEARYWQPILDGPANMIEDLRATFHRTIETHRDCYHQVLEYDRVINLEGLQHSCSKLNWLWDMFANGDGYFGNRFLSYFGEYKLDLDREIAEARSTKKV